MKPFPLLSAALLLVTACGGADKSATPQQTADAISGTDKLAASDNPQCAMFTPAEIAAFAGEPVGAGETGGDGTSCNWKASDGAGIVIIGVGAARDHVETDGAPGYRPLPDIGSRGFVAGAGQSWTSATIAGDKTLFANIDAAGGTDARAIDLLKAIMTKAKT